VIFIAGDTSCAQSTCVLEAIYIDMQYCYYGKK